MSTNFCFDVRHTWIAGFDSVSLEYFSVFMQMAENVYLLNEG